MLPTSIGKKRPPERASKSVTPTRSPTPKRTSFGPRRSSNEPAILGALAFRPEITLGFNLTSAYGRSCESDFAAEQSQLSGPDQGNTQQEPHHAPRGTTL